MLSLPAVGIQPYSAPAGHQSDLNIFTDWLEGNLLFQADDTLSLADVKDLLSDEHIYDDKDKSSELLDDAVGLIKIRHAALGDSYPIGTDALRLTRKMDWQQSPAYSFCLLLSYAERYPKWRRKFGNSFIEQGLLFEHITAEALSHEMSDWKAHSSGWSKVRTHKIQDRIEEIRGLLREDKGTIDKVPNLTDLKDAGLDVVLWRPFSDTRIGVPLYLVQCASGANWEKKRNEPEIHFWRTLINFAALPRKALAIPYAISDKEYWISCRRMNGMLLDRLRLLSGGKKNDQWVSQAISDRIVIWMEPRVKALPTF